MARSYWLALIAVTLLNVWLNAQNLSATSGFGFGTSQAKVAAEYGRPFEKMRVTVSDRGTCVVHAPSRLLRESGQCHIDDGSRSTRQPALCP